MTPASDTIVYVLDEHDRIIAVDGPWDRFAREGGAPALTASSVIGTALVDHVTGDSLRHLLSRLLARARAGREPMRLACRCDSPTQRAALELELKSEDGRQVHVNSRVVYEAPPETGTPDTPRSADTVQMLSMCGWCNRCRVDDQWLELEDAAERLGLLRGDIVPDFSHGLCSDCAASLESELRDRRTTSR